MRIRIGILGYGNLGRGVEAAITQNPDTVLVAVFTRRAPDSIKLSTKNVPVLSIDSLLDFKNKIDVLILCGGSATDLPEMTPKFARHFNVVDSFDHHAQIPQHFAKVSEAATAGGKLALISAGWDPGLFSLARLYANAILPNGNSVTFWGPGVSQGHSDAVRRIPGVIDARQYTIPQETAIQAAKNGVGNTLTTREKHLRRCYVVAAEDADKALITKTIKEMPDYFAEYDTEVHFITAAQMQKDHSSLPHGGTVVHAGVTGLAQEHSQSISYTLQLASNPEFTANVLLASARAVAKMHQRGKTGTCSLFDVAPADLSLKSNTELISTLL